MAWTKLPIDKGSFKNVEPFELGNSEFASRLLNVLLNDAGSNINAPGTRSFASIGVYPVIGMKFFANQILAITANRRQYAISEEGVATNVTGSSGELEGTNRPVFAEDGTYLAYTGGLEPRRWDGSGDSEVMPGSPPDCISLKCLDSYWLALLPNSQEVRFAGPTSVARESWNSDNFFQAERLPDVALSMEVLNRELFLFGEESAESFFNYGDSVTPFKPNSFVEGGTIAGHSLIKGDNTLWWLDSQRKFVMMQGRTPIFISSPYDREIQAFSTVSDCWGARIDIEGNYLLVWNFPTAQKTYAYDYKGQYWSELDSLVDGLSARRRINSHCFAKGWNRHFISDPVNGTIYEFSREFRTERVLRRTGMVDWGTKGRKQSSGYLINIKRGLGTPGGTEPVFMMRVRDDDGEWTAPVNIGLGYIGDPQEPTHVTEFNNVYRKRELEISMTDSVEFVLHSIEEDVEALG